mmetsp:Transcript_20147/g.29534  ORF Transcript_20147/g.29534 Transcript_20147/m.29534 type:complete len:270 (+) Transcript_20147:51-860(+)
MSWVDCTTKLDAVELPPGTTINTKGAGDAFISGLLVAALLRHTGLTVPVHDVDEKENDFMTTPSNIMDDDSDDDLDQSLDFSNLVDASSSFQTDDKVTPYKIYMRENYATFKERCNNDKEAAYEKGMEQWENESEEVKDKYQIKYEDELIEEQEKRFQQTTSAMNSDLGNSISFGDLFGGGDLDDDCGNDGVNKGQDEADLLSENTSKQEGGEENVYSTNRSLNLESAAQFASLVAAHHIDVSTRDLKHLDMSTLLERAMIFPHGLQEI